MRKLLTFLKDVRRELRKVQWPNRRELTTYTSVVVVTVIAVALIIWVVDLGFQEILRLIF